MGVDRAHPLIKELALRLVLRRVLAFDFQHQQERVARHETVRPAVGMFIKVQRIPQRRVLLGFFEERALSVVVSNS